MYGKNIGSEKAWQKIRHYCAYQERCHREVKEKLYGFGLYRNEVDGLLSKLIEENYLNEERYALAYAGGKFRMNQWGRTKIRFALRQKQVSEYCIRVALDAISEEDYEACISKLYQKKAGSFGTLNHLQQQQIFGWLLQRGFEKDKINLVLQQMKAAISSKN
jgi:regulatory protein